MFLIIIILPPLKVAVFIFSTQFPLHKQSENPWVCYQPRRAPARNFTVPNHSSDVASKTKR